MAEIQEGNSNSESIFQTIAHIMSTNIPLTKASRMTMSNIWSVVRGAAVPHVRGCGYREG